MINESKSFHQLPSEAQNNEKFGSFTLRRVQILLLWYGADLWCKFENYNNKKKKRDWKWILYVQFWPTYNNSAAEEPKTNEASRTLNYMKQNTALDKNQRGHSGNTDDVHLHV